MERVLGTLFGLSILGWGLATLWAGLRGSQIVWVAIGLLLSGFGLLFLPAIFSLWRGALGDRPAPRLPVEPHSPSHSHSAH